MNLKVKKTYEEAQKIQDSQDTLVGTASHILLGCTSYTRGPGFESRLTASSNFLPIHSEHGGMSWQQQLRCCLQQRSLGLDRGTQLLHDPH